MAQAQPVNPSFETVTGRIPNNWTATGRAGFATSSFNKTPTAGSNMLYLLSDSSFGGTLLTGSVSPASTVATALGTTTTAFNTAAGTNNSVTTGLAAVGGSAVSQTFSVAAGSSLSFDWDFFTAEDTYVGTGAHNDFGFVTVNGVITILGRVNGTQGFVSTDKSAFAYIPFVNGFSGDGSHISDFLFETGNNSGTASSRQSEYLGDTLDGSFTTPNFGATKFINTTLTFPTAGNVQLGFGVINVQTTGVTKGNISSGLLVDNLVYSTAPVPEPGTLSLAAVGIGGLAMRRRRKERQA